MADVPKTTPHSSAAPEAMHCSRCLREIRDEYFSVNAQTVCAECAAEARQLTTAPGLGGAGPFTKAVLLGLGAAAIGAALYAGMKISVNKEWALVSIAIGWLVGRAVRLGSGSRGGWGYQLLAMFLTYTSIAGAYAAIEWHQIGQPTPAQIVSLLTGMLTLPFMGGAQTMIGWLIIAFGLWPAWKTNQRQAPTITGPHPVAPVVGGV